ncbi:MAG: hypothetical protein Q9173_005309 [Seirophora scorigena]
MKATFEAGREHRFNVPRVDGQIANLTEQMDFHVGHLVNVFRIGGEKALGWEHIILPLEDIERKWPFVRQDVFHGQTTVLPPKCLIYRGDLLQRIESYPILALPVHVHEPGDDYDQEKRGPEAFCSIFSLVANLLDDRTRRRHAEQSAGK